MYYSSPKSGGRMLKVGSICTIDLTRLIGCLQFTRKQRLLNEKNEYSLTFQNSTHTKRKYFCTNDKCSFKFIFMKLKVT